MPSSLSLSKLVDRFRPATRASSATTSLSASTDTSRSSSPTLITPTHSIRNFPTPNTATTAPPSPSSRSRKHKHKHRLQKPVGPRLSSLFFPTTHLSEEQTDRCEHAYRTSWAAAASASCLDLLSRENNNNRWDIYSGKQGNHTSLDLTLYSSITSTATGPTYSAYTNTSFSQSLADFGTAAELASPPLYGHRKTPRKSVDYSSMAVRTERSHSTSGPSGIPRGTEIWSSPYDSDSDLLNMPPPPVPARSALRPVASTSNLRESSSGKSTPRPASSTSARTTPTLNPTTMKSFKLPADPPTQPILSPSNSSRSSSEADHAASTMTPSASTSTNASGESSLSSAFVIGRKKRQGSSARGGSISGDPMRVKDGATPRESSSGVYTPPSFPGPQGSTPKPSTYPSRVYTPSTFVPPSPRRPSDLPPPSPSRSTSVSSTSTSSSFSEVTTPRTPHTPLTPSSRFFGAVSGSWGSAVSGWKRASSSKSVTSPSMYAYTPTSAREGYFSNTIYESSTSAVSQSPSTPGKSYGLGLGLEDAANQAQRKARTDSTATTASEKFGGVLVGDVPKGKRKPVPKPADEIKEEEEAEVGYAM